MIFITKNSIIIKILPLYSKYKISQVLMEQEDNNKKQENPGNLKIALYYTNEDREKAELMVSDAYLDMYTLKIKFSFTGLYGACIYFINRVNNTLVDLYCIISTSFNVDDIKVNLDWLDFEKSIVDIMNENTHDNSMVLKYLEASKTCFDTNVIKNVNYLIEINDTNSLTDLLKKEIFDILDVPSVKIDLHSEEISSLNMELESKTSYKLTEEQISMGKTAHETKEIEENKKIEPDDKRDTIRPEDVKLILDGAVNLDPIKGMNIGSLIVKDRIKIKITDKNPKGALIAKAFNAYQDGKMKSIEGKIVSFRKRKEGGYKLFVEIADGIYIRVIEEETDIKVSLVSPSPDRSQELHKDATKHADTHVDRQKKEKEMPRIAPAREDKDTNFKLTIALVVAIVILAILIFGVIIIKTM